MKTTITITKKSEINAEGNLHSNHTKPVACFKADGTELHFFSSVRDAALKIGVHPNYLSICLNSDGDKLCKGFKIVHATASDIVSILPDIARAYNNNASDARKWQAQEAEKAAIRKAEEDRIAAERKAKEERLAAIEKKTKMVDKYQNAYEKLHQQMREVALKLRDAQYELSQLTGEVESDVA